MKAPLQTMRGRWSKEKEGRKEGRQDIVRGKKQDEKGQGTIKKSFLLLEAGHAASGKREWEDERGGVEYWLS